MANHITLVTKTSQILIKFVSAHDSYYYSGYSIEYRETFEPPLNLPTCGGYVNQSGRVYIPNYKNYERILCEWTLQADVGKKANVNVCHNNVADSGDTFFYNGPNSSSPVIRHFSINSFNKNEIITSDSEYLFIRFSVSSYTEVKEDIYYPYSSIYFDFFETD